MLSIKPQKCHLQPDTVLLGISSKTVYDTFMSNPFEPTPLAQEIRQQIAMQGPIPFVNFMEKALYHPQYGYYSDPTKPIGRQGDYFTNVSVSSLFGQLIGQQFEEMWRHLTPCSQGFWIIEQGAHTGQFCADVMAWMRQFAPDFYAEAQYLFIEPRPAYQQKQRETLIARGIELDKIHWVADWKDVPDASVEGVVFSNELLDALPVHRVQYLGDQWHEQYVTWNGTRFSYVNGPLSRPELAEEIAHIPKIHIQRYTTEIGLNVIDWVRQVCSKISRGFLFTIDYGFPDSLYYNRTRVEGTLTCYYKHRRRYNPLDLIGQQDITAHVNFSAVARVATGCGLTVNGYTDQHHFMVGIAHDDLEGFEKHCSDTLGITPEQHAQMIRAFKTLMHPELMGTTFKYLIQQKGLPSKVPLSGMKFTRETL